MKKTRNTLSTLGELVARNADRLTSADNRVLDVLREDRLHAAMSSGKDISERAGVHPASAVRLAQRLGFDGYPAFQKFLQDSLGHENGDFAAASSRMVARLVRAEEGGLLTSLVEGEVAALTDLQARVSDRDIRLFAEALRDANRIFVFGHGHSASLSSLIALRLKRSGYDATDLAAHSHQIQTQLSDLGNGDVIWLFSFRRPHPLARGFCRVASERGAAVLAITDIAPSQFDPAPDHLLSISRGEPGAPQTLSVPMTVANAVILDLAGIDGGRSLQALDEFRDFRRFLPELWQ